MSNWEDTFSDGKLILGYHSLTSTQDEALRLVNMGRKDIGAVQANFQSAGRGRRGSTWLSEEQESLLITYIISGDLCKADTARYLAFMAGAAVSTGISSAAGKHPDLKWPNDLMIAGRKIGGILIETTNTPDGTPAGLIGVGLNLYQLDFPQAIAPYATSILHEWNIKVDIAALRQAIYKELRHMYDVLNSEGLPAILRFWNDRNGTLNTWYQAATSAGLVIGIAEGIDDEGRLLLRTEEGNLVVSENASSMRKSG